MRRLRAGAAGIGIAFAGGGVVTSRDERMIDASFSLKNADCGE